MVSFQDITHLGGASLSTVKAVQHPRLAKEPWIHECFDITHACNYERPIIAAKVGKVDRVTTDHSFMTDSI